MLTDANTYARDDMRARALNEQIVDARGLIEATRAALAEDSDLLNAKEIAAIEHSIAILEGLLDGTNEQAIKRGGEALNRATTEFAQRRMNRSVRRALTGQKLESLGS
jgi:molecular chaperone HscA